MNGQKDTAGKQNKGFSLITVIIAVSFIGILGLLVLYMALSNFQMKITDLKGKDSFYTAERAIEEIRVGLQEDVGNSMSEAYIKVLETYDKDENSTDVVLDKQRQNDFINEFIKKLANRLKKERLIARPSRQLRRFVGRLQACSRSIQSQGACHP